MNEQELVKAWLRGIWITIEEHYNEAELDNRAKQLLEKLKQANYVRLADDQSLPENPYEAAFLIPLSEGHIGYAEAQQDMLNNKYRKVEL